MTATANVGNPFEEADDRSADNEFCKKKSRVIAPGVFVCHNRGHAFPQSGKREYFTIAMKQLHVAHLLIGLWILVSPWVLGFSGITTALWSNVVAGLLIVTVALWELFGEKRIAQ